MSSQEQFKQNRLYFRAVEYLKKLHENGLITKVQMRIGNRYYADYYNSSVRIFI